ncbi:MAG: multiheme c-type cytochrome [Pseudomonadota bacterium]
MLRYVIVLIATLGVGACGVTMPHADKPKTLTLIYSGNLNGELEPCGCSDGGNYGGIKRRLTLLKALRAEDPQLVAVSAGGLISSESPRDRLKSEYILSGFASFKYDAIGVQWRDLAYGHDLLKSQPLPWVSTNWLHSGDFLEQRVIERPQAKLAFFSWLDPKESPFKEMAGMHQGVSDDTAELLRQLRQAKSAGMLTILSTTLPLKKIEQDFKLDDVDILIVRAGYEVYDEPQQAGNTLVLKPGSRGMRVGKLVLTIDNNRISQWQHAVLDMPQTMDDAPELTAWYDEYNAKVKEAYLAGVESKKAQEAGTSPYASAQACKACHAPQFDKWTQTLHSQAFSKLEEVSKSFDPDCIGCHTVGFEQPGGYIDTLTTPALANVQCENCHGAGRAHVDSKGKEKMPNSGWPRERMCAQCHVQKHSPEFNLDQYWPQIAH